MLHLTPEQETKLKKLELEMEAKKKYEETSLDRRLAISKRTGVPVNLVDTDVVKIGSLLGLIKNIANREGSTDTEPDVSLLDLLLNGFGDSATSYDYSKIPPYYSFAPLKHSEADRLCYHQNFVKEACSEYCRFVDELLENECKLIEPYLSLSLQDKTIEQFIETVTENMDALMEMLLEEDSQECWTRLTLLRGALLGPLSICNYKTLVSNQVVQLLTRYDQSVVFQTLSPTETLLTLFPGFNPNAAFDTERVQNSLTIRAYTRNPELVCFDFASIKKECCTPSLLLVSIGYILTRGIVGPYQNNPIGFANRRYYILKGITGGVRIWVHDKNLELFSKELRDAMVGYAKKLETLVTGSSTLQENLDKLNQSVQFQRCLCSIVSQKSVIIPTEADVFDSV